MSEPKSVKKNIVFPADLVIQANSLSREKKVGFSTIIREALGAYIKEMNKERIDRELEEEAKANNEFYRTLRKDFGDIDLEAWS